MRLKTAGRDNSLPSERRAGAGFAAWRNNSNLRTAVASVIAGAAVYGVLSLLLFGRVFIIPTPQVQGTQAGQVEVTLVDVRETTESGAPHVTGAIANTGIGTVYGLNAMIEVYDVNEVILAADHVTAVRLTPKQTVQFDFPLTGPGMSSVRIVSVTYI